MLGFAEARALGPVVWIALHLIDLGLVSLAKEYQAETAEGRAEKIAVHYPLQNTAGSSSLNDCDWQLWKPFSPEQGHQTRIRAFWHAAL